MKKKISILSFLVMALPALIFAQKQVNFGVKAGLTLPHMTISAFGSSFSFNSKTSFYVGGTADIAVSKFISVQPGLTFVNKGTKISGSGLDFEDEALTSDEGSINISYLEIPVNVMVNVKTGNSGKLFFGAGPYYALALSANGKANGVKEDITIGSSAEDLKRGDFGLNFLTGYQLDNGLNFHLAYGLGLSSVIQDQQEFNVKFKNRVVYLGLGYTF